MRKINPASKITGTLEYMIFYNLEFCKAVKHSLNYDWLQYLSPFVLCSAVNTLEEEDESAIYQLINGNGVCRAAPGFAQIR